MSELNAERLEIGPGEWVCANGRIATYHAPSSIHAPLLWVRITIDGEDKHLYSPDGEYVRQAGIWDDNPTCIARREGYRIVGPVSAMPDPAPSYADLLTALSQSQARVAELERAIRAHRKSWEGGHDEHYRGCLALWSVLSQPQAEEA